MNRRQAISGLTLSALSPLALRAQDSAPLELTFAGYPMAHIRALIEGTVEVDGCRLTYEKDAIGDMNTHVFSGPGTRAFTEIGLSPFMLAWANEAFRGYSLLPIFPLRTFRHKSIFIRNDRGIETPADLKGKRVATPGYSSTSLTWIRGIMQHEYGVSPEDVEWVVSAKDSSAALSGGPSAQENVLPEGLNITTGPEGKDESDMLADGDVDALYHAAEPRAYVEGHPKVARLFSNYREVEQAYFKETGIYPIMHAVAMRDDLIKSHPELPVAICEAYSKAKFAEYERLRKMSWALDTLPWIGNELEETIQLMGQNFAPYGVEPNRKTIESLFQFSHEQGLADRQLTVEEVFAESTLDWTEATG